MHQFLKFILGMKLYMFQTVPLYHQEFFTERTAMVYVSKPAWHIPLQCVQWRTPDDGQRNWPKHVEFHSENKFEKLMHLVGFIVRNHSNFASHTRMPQYWNVVLHTIHPQISFNPYPTAFPYGNGMVLHFYQQQESSTTKTVHKVINKGLKAYV